jgi:hypothetical protein
MMIFHDMFYTGFHATCIGMYMSAWNRAYYTVPTEMHMMFYIVLAQISPYARVSLEVVNACIYV